MKKQDPKETQQPKESAETMVKGWLDQDIIHPSKAPIVTGIPKNSATERVTYKIPAQIKREVEVLRDNDPIFKTISDVLRAALVIGVQILYHERILNQGKSHKYGDVFYQTIKRNSVIYMQNQILDDFVWEIFRYMDLLDRGRISRDDYDGLANELLEALPDDCKELAVDQLQKVRLVRNGQASMADMFSNTARIRQDGTMTIDS